VTASETPDSVAAEEIAAEQRYVDRVYARLEIAKKDATTAEADGYKIASVGTFGALVERDAMVYHAARRRRLLDSEHEGLVFGRLDLHGDEIRYVGRLGLRDEDAHSLVIDWRAPAAAPFYRATAAEPMEVIRRRMIASAGERVTSVEDDLLDPEAAPADMRVIGDGALVASLSRATGTGMRDIVATIQREQDDAIRSPAAGVTVVTGGPGTGKTAVALHRAAFLLYSDRQRYAGGGVLVVGPSPVFVTYIARVLPSLGEDEVTLSSLGSMIVGTPLVGDAATRHDPADVATIKGSLRMIKVLSRAATDNSPEAPHELRLLFRGQLLRLDARALDELRNTVLGIAPANHGARSYDSSSHGAGPRVPVQHAPSVHNSGTSRTSVGRNTVRRKAAGHVLNTLWLQARELLGAGWQMPREEFAEQIAERREFIGFMNAWWPVVTPVDVLRWLSDPARLRGYANGLLARDEVELLAESMSKLPPPDTRGRLDVSVEDIALIDELDELLGTPPKKRRQVDPYSVGGVQELTNQFQRQADARRAALVRPEDYREYAHIVVDEAQDVSPMQWRMIGRRAALASWTIVGDPAQSAWQGDPAETRRARDAALRGRRRNEFTLTTNYRNSVEIFEVAAAVVRRAEPDIALPTAVRRSGIAPVHTVVDASDIADAVREATTDLLSSVEGTVGVISTQASRTLVASWLASLDDPRLQIVTSLEAKGMEYDGVLVVEPDAIIDESPSGVRTLYVALSRATQRLTTVSSNLDWLGPNQ
jgi:AAA domain